jgi:hypothetical protein
MFSSQPNILLARQIGAWLLAEAEAGSRIEPSVAHALLGVRGRDDVKLTKEDMERGVTLEVRVY